MAFGKRLPMAALTRRGRRGLSLWGLTTALLALILAGCGGGGGNNNNDGGPRPSDPTITGRIVDQYSGSTPVQGATVTLRRAGGQAIATAQTDSTGTFNFQIRPTTENTFATISGPANRPFYTTGFINGVRFDITSGVTIPALPANSSFNTGTVTVFSQDGGPPPPPF